MSFQGRAERICERDSIRGHCVRHCWTSFDQCSARLLRGLLTDPETCVGTDPLAEIPTLDDLPALIRLKYLTVTNRWTSLGSGQPATLATETHGELARSRMWSELLGGYGIDDVAPMVFRDQYGCWGFRLVARGNVLNHRMR